MQRRIASEENWAVMDFPTTHWSILAKATVHGEAEAQAALEQLCQRYWGPVRAFIRFHGFSDPEAEDLTQEFMIHVIEKSIFARADRLQGKFRSFLLGALTRFLGDATDRRRALKRGGDVLHLSFEKLQGNADLPEPLAPAPDVSAFDREWALTILERALDHLRLEYAEAGRQNTFEVCKRFLPGATSSYSYEAAAEQLAVSLPAFKSEIHRLRLHLRSLVKQEIARTVSAPHEIEAEMAHLQRVLMDRGSAFESVTRNFSGSSPEK